MGCAWSTPASGTDVVDRSFDVTSSRELVPLCLPRSPPSCIDGRGGAIWDPPAAVKRGLLRPRPSEVPAPASDGGGGTTCETRFPSEVALAGASGPRPV